nr:glycosyl-4,4'-diaponeurosporenoate acyltransferase [Maliibacterium massiliense]
MKVFFDHLLENAIMFALIGLFMTIVGLLIPSRWLKPQAWIYRPRAFEEEGAFYQKHFAIVKWKDVMPTATKLLHLGFSKGSLRSLSPEYLQTFIVETCRAELTHLMLILLSPLFYLWNTPGWGTAMMLCGILGNVPYIMIQRYNRPRFMRMLAHLHRLAHPAKK